jgi:acetylornithine/succinyldiaminopimelate/putrescine aminotransferase
VRLCPPLVVTKEQADVALDVLEECIAIVDKECFSAKSKPGEPTGS